MSKRWIGEEHLRNLPAAMTARALGGKPARKKTAAAEPEHLRIAGAPAAKPKTGGKQAMQALGRMEKGKLNQTEQAYQDHLNVLCLAGEVLWYRFEPFRITLAPRTTYTPDFLVQLASGHLEFHEVKGFWEDDARVKIKVAAELLPVFKFVAIKNDGTVKAPVWQREEF